MMTYVRQVLINRWMLGNNKSKPWQIKRDALLNRSGNFKRGKDWLGHRNE